MPTYNQGAFLRRAIASLLAQSYTSWELLIVDDGSSDDTASLLAAYHNDPRIRVWRLPENRGFPHALNFVLAESLVPNIAYLPSDDIFYPNHLESLLTVLESHPQSPLAFSGVKFHQRRIAATGQIHGLPLQMVQVMHRRTTQRWTERQELISDDLERLYWSKLRSEGEFVASGTVTCEWVDHPRQHHKVICETTGGGLNPYRSRYQVKHPLRFHSSVGSYVDENVQYARFREQPRPAHPDGLKILLVGELAFNPDRIIALEERGHKLYGLWMDHPWWLNTVGPLPFGNVEDIPKSDWRGAVRKLQPDIIYALLNWQAVPFAHEVFQANLGIPFVWHFKEGPWLCLEHGSWPQLIDLHTRTAGQIYTSPEQRDWFNTVVPGCADHGRTMVLDGDLPKREWLEGVPSPRLSELDGEFHTVVPGRPIGLHPGLLRELAAERIHLHFYGDLQHRDWAPWVEEGQRAAPGYLHLHSHVPQSQWLSELSRYDAGWLHFLPSENQGNVAFAFWDDLNYPARLSTLMTAGLPLLQYDNAGSIVATQTLARTLDIGIFCRNMQQLGAQLRDRERMSQLRANVWKHRPRFTFDYHADDLVTFFKRVIQHDKPERTSYATAGADPS